MQISSFLPGTSQKRNAPLFGNKSEDKKKFSPTLTRKEIAQLLNKDIELPESSSGKNSSVKFGLHSVWGGEDIGILREVALKDNIKYIESQLLGAKKVTVQNLISTATKKQATLILDNNESYSVTLHIGKFPNFIISKYKKGVTPWAKPKLEWSLTCNDSHIALDEKKFVRSHIHGPGKPQVDFYVERRNSGVFGSELSSMQEIAKDLQDGLVDKYFTPQVNTNP